MKIRLSLVLILIAILCGGLSAQSVVVTGKKVTYTRKKPIVDYKKTFTINYPKVKAATPALSKKIEGALSYGSVLGLKLEEEFGGPDGYQWLEEANYKVKYNKNGILCVDLWMEGTGAYSWGTSKVVVIDTQKGVRVLPGNVFTNPKGIVKLIEPKQEREIQETITRVKKEEESYENNIKELFNNRRFSERDIDHFDVSDTGVTFHYDYGFPHVALAYEPDGEFMFTWKQLKPYIKRDGLLAQFVR